MSGRESFEGDRRESTDRPASTTEQDVTSKDTCTDGFASVGTGFLDELPDAAYLLDADGRLVDWNEELEAATDYDGDELAGRQACSLVAATDESQLEECLAAAVEESSVERRLELRTRTGETVPHRLTAAPVRDETGAVVGVAGTANDISEQVARERALEEKTARLERFASMLSHDLRNPLTVAEGYVDLARSEGDTTHLEKVEGAHDRMRQLIESLLQLAKEGEGPEETTAVELTGVATDAWSAVETDGGSLAVADDLGTVVADRGRLKQLFENLFRNSVEHSSASNRSTPADGGAGVAVIVGSTAKGFYVADDGTGFPDNGEDPFADGVTTKADGTGLGLAIVASVAAAHDWTVEAGASDDGGARIDVRF